MKEFGPLVVLELIGETHFEGNRLIVGDVDVLDRFKAQAGLHRMQGVLRVMWSPFTTETVEVSPSGDGLFAEHSEPANAPK